MPGAKHTKEMNFGYWCARIGHAFRARLETRTRQMGLSGMQAIVLSILEGLGSSTLVELARMVEHAHPSVLRHLDSLEQEGFVERTPHPRDRRVKVVRLTEKGRAAVPPVRAAMFEVQEQAAEGLDDAEVEHLLASFRSIALNLGCCHQGRRGPHSRELSP